MARSKDTPRQAAPPWLSYTLVKPIKTGAGNPDIIVLEMREPEGTDVIAVGNPIYLDVASQPVQVRTDYRILAELIGRLAAIPPSFVGQIAPGDLAAIATLIAPFLIPTASGS